MLQWITDRLRLKERVMKDRQSKPLGHDKTNPSGFPRVENIKIGLSSASNWHREIDKAIEVANDFMFETYLEDHPPQIVRVGCDVFVPAYPVYGDTFIRAMVQFSACNPALTLLIVSELNRIEAFDATAFAFEVASEQAGMDSADPNKA